MKTTAKTVLLTLLASVLTLAVSFAQGPGGGRPPHGPPHGPPPGGSAPLTYDMQEAATEKLNVLMEGNVTDIHDDTILTKYALRMERVTGDAFHSVVVNNTRMQGSVRITNNGADTADTVSCETFLIDGNYHDGSGNKLEDITTLIDKTAILGTGLVTPFSAVTPTHIGQEYLDGNWHLVIRDLDQDLYDLTGLHYDKLIRL